MDTILIWAFLFLIIYLLPTFIAGGRNHLNTTSIGIINVFLGWTFLAWVICLAWAFNNNIERHEDT